MYSQRVDAWVTAFLLLNTYAFIIFIQDKRKAKRGKPFRIPESSFFLTAACGGGIGTLIGMTAARHKTQHLSFKLLLPLLFVTSVALFMIGYQHIQA
ncbi:DUF1294 domain-containing protein [Caldalkalibacillus salinus]|uniref:DUF1294 domain-containing protein n=1 Tax=Caldalkalibacillus salinus TaxID=2803787 RepID=UPI0019210A63